MIYDYNFDYIALSNYVIYFSSEITNLAFCLIILTFFFIYKKINHFEFVTWSSLIALTPLINVFINENFFPDIGGYLRCVRDIRDNFYFDEPGCQFVLSSGSGDVVNTVSFKRGLPALIFTLIPMPSIATHASTGMINKMIFFLTYVFLRRTYFKGIELRWSLLIFFLPSILVFSSIGLRDNLVFCLQLLSIFWITSNKFILSSISIGLLLLIKVQNGIVFSFLYIGCFFFRAHKNKTYLLFYLTIFFIFLLIFNQELLATLNFFKLAFLIESGEIARYASDSYAEIESMLQLILELPKYLFLGALRPFPSSPFTFITFIENIVFITIFFLMIKGNLSIVKTPAILIVIITIILGVLLHSIVIDNDFTFARYRYAYSYPLLIFLAYHLFTQKTFKSI